MLKLIENQIKEWLYETIDSVYQIKPNLEKLKVDLPPDKTLGDFAIPVGFILAKPLKKNPFEIVENLAKVIEEREEIEKATPAKPGFLNIKLSNSFFQGFIEKVMNDENAFDFEKRDKTINLEYVSANPTGPLHIGHGRWAALGDSIARLLTKAGYIVNREFYVNDAGVQIQNLNKTVEALKKGGPVPEDGYKGEYVKEAVDSDLAPKDFFLEKQKQTLKEFEVEFDTFSSEIDLHESGVIPKTLKVLEEKGYLYEKEGATWFASTEFKDDKDRVLIKNDGKYTYFAPDIAYHLSKIERGADWLIDILGADHHGYVKRIKASVMALSDSKVEFDVLIGQLVNLFRGGEPVRMSKRTGDIVTLKEVIDEIGPDALRYVLVSKKQSQTIDFDLEEVKKQTKENPVFYIQYAFARINSILKKVEEVSKDFTLSKLELNDLNESERELLIKAISFKSEIFFSAVDYEPHRMAGYLLDLATAFHRFYEKCRVIDEGKIIEKRIYIIKTIAIVLRAGLTLLGIKSPERM